MGDKPDIDVAGGVPSIVRFRCAPPDLFSRRARRLAELAPGHAMEGYLRFTMALAHAQDTAFRELSDIPIPDDALVANCHEHGLPPLSVHSHPRDPAWRVGLLRLLASMEGGVLTQQAVEVIAELQRARVDGLEEQATRLLRGEYSELAAAQGPFIGAALQVYWVRMARTLGEGGTSDSMPHRLCPACGSHPVASLVRGGGSGRGLRYLVCSLCGGEWHAVRIQCTACATTRGISYLSIEGATDAVKAECCEECKTYLKILYADKDPRVEPWADDLATLALDMLVDERGYRRRGPNLLFLPGG